jgi:acyl-CoA thioester hydrolase
MKGFNHQINIQIRFSDIDRLNHVNNACYLNYIELARVSYFNTVFNEHINWSKNGFVIARTELDYVEPIFLTDSLQCFTRVIKVGNKSLTIENSLVKNKTIIAAKCIGILVAMDYEKNESKKVPNLWLELLNKFENKNLEL